MEEGVTALRALGFTELEAGVYTFLLRESPATGYRIAQALAKAGANIYKVIAGLEEKGAVVVEEERTRRCRAVPYQELLERLEREFLAQKELAGAALSQLGGQAEDARVYTLRTRAQVMERARQMIGRAKVVALVSAFPEPLEELRDVLERAAHFRKVFVMVKAYSPVIMSVSRTVVSTEGDFLLKEWPGQEVSIAIDGEEFLDALLTRDGKGLIQGVTSSSTFLACSRYNGLYCELVLTMLARQVLEGETNVENLRTYLKFDHHPITIPGFHRLIWGEMTPEGPTEVVLPPSELLAAVEASRDKKAKRKKKEVSSSPGV